MFRAVFVCVFTTVFKRVFGGVNIFFLCSHAG